MSDNTDGNRDFLASLEEIVGTRNVLSKPRQLKRYQTGYRMGSGNAFAAVLPNTLLELWKTLEVCVRADKIVIMQAANTGLNGGSTPDGNDYDRDIVIISTLKLDDLILLNGGTQIIGFAGSTLYRLEETLETVGRTPHSVIGSSCIGASVVGGVCNNSGGALINRGPAYTELSLFAEVTEEGELRLINHLDIDLGETPEEIFENLSAKNFNANGLNQSNHLASDTQYEARVREVDAPTPARYNADKRRLFEASGCAGKLAVFAVRLDTFAKPAREQVFYIGTNDPEDFTELRRSILTEFKELPELGEYMHRSYFDGAAKYCKDTYLFIKLFGASFLPKLFKIKGTVDGYLSKVPFLPDHFADRFLQIAAKIWPKHLPKRIREYRDRFEHHLMVKVNDDAVDDMNALLEKLSKSSNSLDYLVCSDAESAAALLHRFVAGGASVRYSIINKSSSGGIMPFDIALRRNDSDWFDFLPPDIEDQLAAPYKLAHFFCHVFHYDFVVKAGVDVPALKARIHKLLDERGAKYPAEHNVGHLYTADPDLKDFYQSLDPMNMFNPGIGKTSKHKHYT